jgi:O-antigen ligase
MYLGGQSAVASALGRSSTLSGRTDIWEASIASADNPVIGTGFESFWNANARKVSQILVARGFIDMSNLVSAHNGYIEVYLDLGYVGVGLLALVLVKGFRDAVNSFRYDPRLAGLLLAYVTTATFYAITEAGFRMLSPSWIFLLLAAVTASGLSRGVLRGKKPGVLVAQAEKIPATLDDRQILRHQPSENAPMQVKTDRTAAQANSK